RHYNIFINSIFHTYLVRSSFFHEKVARGTLVPRYIPTSSQPVDIFTKPLPKDAFILFRNKLCVHLHSYCSLRGHHKEPNQHSYDSLIMDIQCKRFKMLKTTICHGICHSSPMAPSSYS
ncbi:hypothetical protein PanWU01x14_243100, partial [Parasponia andersonii]